MPKEYTALKEVLALDENEEFDLQRLNFIYELMHKDPMFYKHFSDKIAAKLNDPQKLTVNSLRRKYKTDMDSVDKEIHEECKELLRVMSGRELGFNWKAVKDLAREQQNKMQHRILSRIEKAHSEIADRLHFIWFAVSTIAAHKALFMTAI